jgi:hypothetical protein
VAVTILDAIDSGAYDLPILFVLGVLCTTLLVRWIDGDAS